jgi:hypothetical protein
MRKNISNYYIIFLGLISTTILISEFSKASEVTPKLSGFSPDLASWDYSCLTSRNYIKAYANKTYTSFDTSEEPTSSELNNPNLVLRDGHIQQTKQKLVMTWKNGNYTYQLTFFGETGPSIEGLKP